MVRRASPTPGSPDGPAAAGRALGRLRAAHRRFLFPVLAALLPADCFACNRALGAVQRLGACPGCWAALRPLAPPLCPACGLPLPAGTDLEGPAGGRCARCLLFPWPGVAGVRAAVAYDDTARRFLLRAKLGGYRELTPSLGRQLACVLRRGAFAAAVDAVVPVPSHPWTGLVRGFNPAADLARTVARELGLPLLRGAIWRPPVGPRFAKRLGATARRLRGGRFRPLRRLPGPRVLLVDDVVTTGATATACAAALRAAGAREVRVAAWARTPRRGDGKEPPGDAAPAPGRV